MATTPDPDADSDLLSRRERLAVVLGELRESLKHLRTLLEGVQKEVATLHTEVRTLRETAIEARGVAKARGKMAVAVAGLLAAGAALAKIATWIAGIVKGASAP